MLALFTGTPMLHGGEQALVETKRLVNVVRGTDGEGPLDGYISYYMERHPSLFAAVRPLDPGDLSVRDLAKYAGLKEVAHLPACVDNVRVRVHPVEIDKPEREELFDRYRAVVKRLPVTQEGDHRVVSVKRSKRKRTQAKKLKDVQAWEEAEESSSRPPAPRRRKRAKRAPTPPPPTAAKPTRASKAGGGQRSRAKKRAAAKRPATTTSPTRRPCTSSSTSTTSTRREASCSRRTSSRRWPPSSTPSSSRSS